jgi:hypothetical protein
MTKKLRGNVFGNEISKFFSTFLFWLDCVDIGNYFNDDIVDYQTFCNEYKNVMSVRDVIK